MNKILIIGLGNPLLGDDGVGWRVAELLQWKINLPGVEVDFHAGGGISLMERMVDYDKAALVDTIFSGSQPVGSIRCCTLEELPDPSAGHLASAHDVSLRTALQMGQDLKLHLPERIVVFAIEAERIYEFSEQLSPPVAAAVPLAAQMVMKWVNEM